MIMRIRHLSVVALVALQAACAARIAPPPATVERAALANWDAARVKDQVSVGNVVIIF